MVWVMVSYIDWSEVWSYAYFMRKKGVRKSSVRVGEEDIAIVEEYKYLGHAVEAHGQCRRMVEE